MTRVFIYRPSNSILVKKLYLNGENGCVRPSLRALGDTRKCRPPQRPTPPPKNQNPLIDSLDTPLAAFCPQMRWTAGSSASMLTQRPPRRTLSHRCYFRRQYFEKLNYFLKSTSCIVWIIGIPTHPRTSSWLHSSPCSCQGRGEDPGSYQRQLSGQI